MKKSLIALAVLGFAGGAMAQSSVTLYGVANVGFGGASGAGNGFQMMDAPNGTGSRFGFRGTEDLGGGLRANFLLESGYLMPNGANDNAANLQFQRSAWMGLSGGWGEVRMGRQYTVGFDASIWTMPATRTNAQLLAGLGFHGMGARNDAMIKYLSPNFSGFKFEGSYVLNNNNPLRPLELALMYNNGPLNVNFSMNKLKGLSAGWGLNAGYNFGSFGLLGGFVDNPGNGTGRGFFIGANAKMGAFSPWIQLARNTTAKRTAYDIGAYYAMSKRTSLYVVYGHINKPSTYRYGLGIQHSF